MHTHFSPQGPGSPSLNSMQSLRGAGRKHIPTCSPQCHSGTKPPPSSLYICTEMPITLHYCLPQLTSLCRNLSMTKVENGWLTPLPILYTVSHQLLIQVHRMPGKTPKGRRATERGLGAVRLRLSLAVGKKACLGTGRDLWWWLCWQCSCPFPLRQTLILHGPVHKPGLKFPITCLASKF